jgi:hypothetical protein
MAEWLSPTCRPTFDLFQFFSFSRCSNFSLVIFFVSWDMPGDFESVFKYKSGAKFHKQSHRKPIFQKGNPLTNALISHGSIVRFFGNSMFALEYERTALSETAEGYLKFLQYAHYEALDGQSLFPTTSLIF